MEDVLGRATRLRTVLTERAGHATELAREACAEADVLFVFAGDGGYNEALNGLDGVHPVGLIPGGGTSVLPRALGIAAEPAPRRSSSRRPCARAARGASRSGG